MSSKNWQAQIYLKWNKKWPREWARNASWDWLKEWPEVKSAWTTMGEWDAVLWVESTTAEGIEQFVCDKVWSKDWVEKTETHWARQVWGNKAA